MEIDNNIITSCPKCGDPEFWVMDRSECNHCGYGMVGEKKETMNNNQICESAHNYIIKKCNNFGYSDLIIHSENVGFKNKKWIIEAEISFKWSLNGHIKEVKKNIIGVLNDGKWLIPDFYFQD